MLTLGDSLSCSIQPEVIVARAQNKSSQHNKSQSLLDIKDVVDVRHNNEIQRDPTKHDVQLKMLKREREMYEKSFLRMYKTRSATLHDLNILTLNIYKTQALLTNRAIDETDPDKQTHIQNELSLLKNFLKMIEDLTKRIIESKKLSEENNRILSTAEGLKKYMNDTFNLTEQNSGQLITYYNDTKVPKCVINDYVYLPLVDIQT